MKSKLWISNYRIHYRIIYIKKSLFNILSLIYYIPCSELIYHAIIRLPYLNSLTHWD